MANVKFSQFTSASPGPFTALAGYEVSGDNVQITAQSLNEVTIPTLSNAGEFGFGATILKDFVVSGTTLTSGKLYQFGYDAVGLANEWVEADNTTASSAESSGLLAICRDTTVDGSLMISEGIVRVADPGATWTAADNGKIVYVGATGLVTLVEPTTTNDTIRLIGYVVDGANYVISLNIDNTYLLVR